MGGFRFSEIPGGKYINCDASLRVPPLANVSELMQAAHEIEASEELHVLPSKRWLMQLLRPGTSLGGARPKATVKDDDGNLAVAKFPSRKDDYDVALWEHFCHVMGRKAGINATIAGILEKSPIPVTYAGGISSLDDIAKIRSIGNNKIDFTIGTALNIFGGDLDLMEVIRCTQ